MTQQEQKRLLRLAQKKIVVIGISSTRFEKTYKAAFELAIKFTLANLWISVDEDLPEFSKKDDHVQISEPVLIKCANGAITRARYFTVSGEVPSEGSRAVPPRQCAERPALALWHGTLQANLSIA